MSSNPHKTMDQQEIEKLNKYLKRKGVSGVNFEGTDLSEITYVGARKRIGDYIASAREAKRNVVIPRILKLAATKT